MVSGEEGKVSRAKIAAILLYAAVAVFTFGRAASNEDRMCLHTSTGKTVPVCPVSVFAKAGFAAGLFWPLYWSWEIQE